MDNETVYYRGWITDTGLILADSSDQVDSNGKPLANPQIVDGIAQRKVNKAKGE